MENYFEVKVKYKKIGERGDVKKVTEPYLVSALTFTEAEARAIQELEPYLNGEFVISNIARANYTDLFPFEDSDRWFKCKIAYVSIDEEAGTEKRKTSYVLVQANDVKHAWDNLTKAMSDSVVDYEVSSIQETAIMDIFPFSADSVPSEIPEHLKLAGKNATEGTYVKEIIKNESGAVISIRREFTRKDELCNLVVAIISGATDGIPAAFGPDDNLKFYTLEKEGSEDEIVSNIKKQFGVSVSEEDIEKIKTIMDLITFVKDNK